MRAVAYRTGLIAISTALCLCAGYLFLRYVDSDGVSGLDFFRTLLIVVSTFWIAWGAVTGLLGLVGPIRRPPVNPALPGGRTAILVPIYNEDPLATFSRVAAMDASLARLGASSRFHFAVLSDTRNLDLADRERQWFARLLSERRGDGRMFYRRRVLNTGRKAGNVEDFVRRSGQAYDYILVLDADSLMEGETILEMARRMDADPTLGLLQTLPRIINARSFFGRAMQFAANFHSPVFAAGVALLQGREGPFWGHNAIVRTKAFAASCGLPELSGKPPFGGHILSHDYVEAALLARRGWTVRLDTDLGGSFEEGPENLVEYAKRDRRWCQGNLQHSRILGAPALKFWSRFTFLQGIMAYIASPVWLAFLISSILASVPFLSPRPFEDLGAPDAWAGLTLLLGIPLLLLLPKVLIVLRGALTGENRRFGGTWRVALAALVEIAFSTLLAPIMLAFQCRAVFQVLLGLDGGWPATLRSQGRLDLSSAWSASWWLVLAGFASLASIMAFAPASLVWVLPVLLPALVSPLVIAWSSSISRSNIFPASSELTESPVIAERERILSVWSRDADQPAFSQPAVSGVVFPAQI